MNDKDEPYCLWTRIKLYIFMKLGDSLWSYVIIHKDYWDHSYGMSFTHKRDFLKLLKYDMDDMDDDMEVEVAKSRENDPKSRMVVIS